MNKNIAFKGHPQRGGEIINILKMLGGINKWDYLADSTLCVYYINCKGIINYNSYNEGYNLEIFTIEDFIKKYPYKVGDKVIYDGEIQRISEMKWDCNLNKVIYTMNTVCGIGIHECYDVSWIRPYKEENVIKETPIDFVKESDDKYRIVLNHQFDMVVDEGEYYAIKRKPKYPKIISECFNSLEDDELVNNKLLYAFRDLINARNAYWKIAGNQMGLGKPWKPDWKDCSESKYCIYISESEIKTGVFHYDTQILAFPTMEMCEEFLKNFGYIIEKCKDFFKI
jgi:hypothetical protein